MNDFVLLKLQTATLKPHTTPMNADRILDRVCVAFDVLIEAGAAYEGLFPSLIDRETHKMVTELPPAIDGQRMGDRAHLGSNLMHDHPALKAMFALSDSLGRDDYGEAANRYLKRFARCCTGTPTGLFPWGEHSFWDLLDDTVGNSYLLLDRERELPVTHDHLRQAPLWLWEKLQEFSPRCVECFAEGLNGHWTEGEPLEYCRHAYIMESRPYQRYLRSCDFPRHGGFYILDWGFAYLQTGREEFLEQIRTILDYWWKKRDDLGLLLIESRSPVTEKNFYGVNSVQQTFSLGVSLLEAADLLAESQPHLAATMRQRGKVYIAAFLAAPHDLENRLFVGSSRRGTDEILDTYVTWGSKYGAQSPVAGTALMALCGYRLTGDKRLMAWARAAAHPYLEEPLPKEIAVPARDPATGIGLLADLYDLTGESFWLEGGLNLAGAMMEAFMDGDLPRGSSRTEVYESQLGPGDLLFALTRLALLAKDKSQAPEPDYSLR